MAFLGTLVERMEEELDFSAQRQHEGRLDDCCLSSDPEAPEKEDLEAISSSSEVEEFKVRLHRKTHVSLGMSINVLEDGLLVDWCSDTEEVLVGIWNAMSAKTVQVRAGDKISSCNGISDPESMLRCVSSGLGQLRLRVRRGPFAFPEQPPLPADLNCCNYMGDRQFQTSAAVPEEQHDLATPREAARLEHERNQKLALNADRGQLQELIAQRLAKRRGS